MKKVALITWIGEGNYGTCLQSFALYQKMKALGYEVSIITEFPHNSIFVAYIKYTLSKLGILKYIRRYRNQQHKDIQTKKRIAFQNKYYHRISILTSKQLHWFVKHTDCFISGSDQIWNTYYTFDPVYFLSFAENKKRIAYASSIGTNSIKEEHQEAVRQLLMPFSHIGVRERQAVSVLETLTGRTDIRQVLDPTFLLEPSEWKDMVQCATYEGELPSKYILCYLIGNNPWYENQLREVKTKVGIRDIIIIPSAENPHFTYDGAIVYRDASPVEFVDLLQKAAYVCTDSFHATALSINHAIPFIEFLRFKDDYIQSQNSRIYDLLSHFGLLNRIYTEDTAIWTAPIDYDSVLSVLQKDRASSLDFLVKAIEN